MINKLKNTINSLIKKENKNYCIKIKNLYVRYGTRNILNNLSLTIDNKDIFGIIGLSGSGKTTLLKTIMKFIRYEGIIDRANGMKDIGYCPQEDAFFPELSIKDNIIIFGNMTKTPINTALERANKLLNELKVTESLSKQAGMMSGGQRKRLNIVLSLLNNPKTIILDEPFAGLDYMNRLLLWEFIKKLKKEGKTVILSTHLLEEAEEFCTNLIIISEGKKFATGTINDIQRSLKFKHFMTLKFKYLNKENTEKLKEYCSKRKYHIIDINENRASFGLPSTEEGNNLLSVIKRMNLEYTLNEYRTPALNELFMVSIKE